MGMTYGQLFMILNPNVKVVENGTCVWIYFDSSNHDTFRIEWWNKEMPYEALKAQELVEPDVDVDTWICGKCGHTLEHQELLDNNILVHEQYSYCPNCGKAVKWDV